MPKINAQWHQENKMPKNPSKGQRYKWHIEHAKKCTCRPISDKLQKEIEEWSKK